MKTIQTVQVYKVHIIFIRTLRLIRSRSAVSSLIFSEERAGCEPVRWKAGGLVGGVRLYDGGMAVKVWRAGCEFRIRLFFLVG